MSVVTLKMTSSSYGVDYEEALYRNDGTDNLSGMDFGDIETGTEYEPRFIWLRHDGLEPIYNAGYYIRTVGVEWGGYVADNELAHEPYNPNWFKNGGVTDTGLPTSSTLDYELMRTSALNNPEMGVRVHYDRENVATRSNGLGNNNIGLNFSSIKLQKSAVDYSGTDLAEMDGYVYPEPIDENKLGIAGDEAMLGVSIKMPEDIEGSGHVQFAFAVKYRYTM